MSVLLALSALLAGCIPNENGKLEAVKTGALLEPPALRESAAEALEEACGEPEWRDGTAMMRLPYLQAVEPTRAALVWTTGGAAEQVVVRLPDGEPVATVTAQPEPTTFLSEQTQVVASIGPLEPGSTYCYEVHDADGLAYGPVGFRTPASPGDEAPVDVLVFGDSGSGHADQWALAEQMATVPVDLIIHTGDVAYPSGTLDQLQAYHFDVYETLLRSFPFFPASGNHDYGTAGAGPFREVFRLPENGGEEGLERWYSFDWGPIHFVALDTELNGSAQAQWLAEDLASTTQPWRIVYAHKGPYSSGHHGGSGSFRSLYQPILEEHGVQLVLSGHDHIYERFEPIGGVQYVVTGGGGMSTRAVTGGSTTAFAEGVTHFVTLRVEGDALSLHAIDATGREFDGVRIER